MPQCSLTNQSKQTVFRFRIRFLRSWWIPLQIPVETPLSPNWFAGREVSWERARKSNYNVPHVFYACKALIIWNGLAWLSELKHSLQFGVLHDTSQPGTATKLARVSYLFTIWRNCENFLLRLLNDIFNNIWDWNSQNKLEISASVQKLDVVIKKSGQIIWLCQ